MKHLCLLLLACLFGACSSFEREWKAAPAAQKNSVAGRWEGQWTSKHHRSMSGKPMGGALRCVFTPINEKEYRAYFHAEWLFFKSGYALVVPVTRKGQVWHFDAKHELLGIGGGTYRYVGTVTPERFSATYDSAYDAGTFEMTRPKQ